MCVSGWTDTHATLAAQLGGRGGPRRCGSLAPARRRRGPHHTTSRRAHPHVHTMSAAGSRSVPMVSTPSGRRGSGRADTDPTRSPPRYPRPPSPTSTCGRRRLRWCHAGTIPGSIGSGDPPVTPDQPACQSTVAGQQATHRRSALERTSASVFPHEAEHPPMPYRRSSATVHPPPVACERADQPTRWSARRHSANRERWHLLVRGERPRASSHNRRPWVPAQTRARATRTDHPR